VLNGFAEARQRQEMRPFYEQKRPSHPTFIQVLWAQAFVSGS
jgi:hypothetical protein